MFGNNKKTIKIDYSYLWVLEMRFEHVTDVLGVRQVQRRIDLVQDVERCRLEQQQRQDEWERYEWPLTSTQLGQRVFPLTTEGNLDLETVEDIFSFWRSQFCRRSWQKTGENGSEVFVDFVPSGPKLDLLLLVQLFDDLEPIW